jgi:hypothetical protein
MKLFKIIIFSIGAIIMSFIFWSCSKERPHLDNANPNISSSANVQVFNATLKAARNYVYVDGTSVSGIALSYGGVFPGTAYSFLVNGGTRAILIKDTLPTTTQTPISFSQNFDAGKSYTIFTYDTVTSAKQLTVLNNLVVPTDTTSRMRFANFIYNTTAVANVDVYSTRKGLSSPVFANIATNTVSDFVAYPSGITDTLYIYSTGTTTPLLATAKVNSLTPSRSYTTAFTGSYMGTKAISVFANY